MAQVIGTRQIGSDEEIIEPIESNGKSYQVLSNRFGDTQVVIQCRSSNVIAEMTALLDLGYAVRKAEGGEICWSKEIES